MSGGYFEYKQYALDDIISSIDQIIRDIENAIIYEFRDQRTIEEFRNALDVCKRASVYIRRIDWLLSGDDSEETFHERLRVDMREEGLSNESQ